MNKNILFVGMPVMALVFGLIFTACPTDSDDDDDTSIANELIGKWEFQQVLVSGTAYNLPYGGITSGGYEFRSDGFTSYMNGNVAATLPGAYSKDNTIYSSDGTPGYTWSISGDVLTANSADGSSGVVAKKVAKFNWEPDNGGGTSISGTWTASGGRVIIFTGNNFTYNVDGYIKYSGTFSTSGTTITFVESELGTASGGFVLSGETFTLSAHEWDSTVNGVYSKSSNNDPASNGPPTLTISEVSGEKAFRITLSGDQRWVLSPSTDAKEIWTIFAQELIKSDSGNEWGYQHSCTWESDTSAKFSVTLTGATTGATYSATKTATSDKNQQYFFSASNLEELYPGKTRQELWDMVVLEGGPVTIMKD
jgi:hypothetical protein